MRHYYKVSIRSEGTGYINDDVNQGEDETTRNCFEVAEHDFKTLAEVRAYLKKQYGNIKPSLTYHTTASLNKDIPAGLVYQFDNSDISHDSPHWSQCDWVGVFSMNIQLYYHKTDGGAEYLTDTYVEWKNGDKSGREGTITADTRYIVRVDGDITKDAELIVRGES